MKAMVLAAGLGTRLRPLTYELPKPMVPVLDRPVMAHIVDLLERHGYDEIIANLHYFPETIRDYFGDRPVILVLAYFKCPMLCTQVLNGLVRALLDVPLRPGKDFTILTVPDRLKTVGDPWADMNANPGTIDTLLGWWDRDLKAGLGELPFPPDYPKMPGEPPRVQPSRARKPD